MSTEELRALDLLARTAHGRVAASMRAMPFLAPARHAVVDGRILLRMYRGAGFHRALSGTVVAYGADNLAAADGDLWCVQVIGTCALVEGDPGPAGRDLLGPPPDTGDGAHDPVHLRVVPEFTETYRLRRTGPLTGTVPVPGAPPLSP